MVRKLTTECGIQGFQFCTMNLEKSIQRVLESLQWTTSHHEAPNKLIAVSLPLPMCEPWMFTHIQETPGPIIHPPPPRSPLIVTPIAATATAARSLTSQPSVDDQASRGDLNNAATWDDFPNGRFGDPDSPAFGLQGQWGGPGLSVRAIEQVI
jgi:methylenetetrahydrofolate reductase (NADPH)